MKLVAKSDLMIEVITHLKNDSPCTEPEYVAKGNMIDVDVLEENKTCYEQVQFGDGSIAFGLNKKDFNILSL